MKRHLHPLHHLNEPEKQKRYVLNPLRLISLTLIYSQSSAEGTIDYEVTM
jgi:hypothetical protein